jgi:hypothetical protein
VRLGAPKALRRQTPFRDRFLLVERLSVEIDAITKRPMAPKQTARNDYFSPRAAISIETVKPSEATIVDAIMPECSHASYRV